MSTGIDIREIKNEYLQKLAKEADTSKNNFIDGDEISVFLEKAQEQKNKYSEKDFSDVMRLFRSYDRAELSWGEIGNIGLISAKNLVKGMFCDENGFSPKRTLTTLGTIAAFAAVSAIPVVGAPIALTCSAALGTYTAYKGTVKIVEGGKEYYNAKTHEEAVKAMEKAMDGGVETGVSILALLGIRQYAAKMSVKVKSGAKTQPREQAQVNTNNQTPHNTQQAQTRAVEQAKINDTSKLTTNKSNKTVDTKIDARGRTTQKTTQHKDGHKVEEFYNKSGSITKKVYTDINGKKMTVEYKYDKDGFNVINQTETYEAGYIYQSNPVKTYPKGMIKETTWKNGLRKEVCTDGDALTTNWYDRHNEIIRQEFSTPDKRGRIKYEKTNLGYKETYNDGHTFETRFNGNGWDYIKRYIDGSKQVRQNALVVEM